MLSSPNASRLRVYIDIDGTILYEPGDETAREDLDHQCVCDGLEVFLQFVVQRCEPYWLSYRTIRGATHVLEGRLYPHLPPIAQSIPVAYWDQFKHEAIDPALPFVWFDDYLEAEDRAWLATTDSLAAYVATDRTNRDNPALMLAEVKARLDRLT